MVVMKVLFLQDSNLTAEELFLHLAVQFQLTDVESFPW